jgi:hypothetical protein
VRPPRGARRAAPGGVARRAAPRASGPRFARPPADPGRRQATVDVIARHGGQILAPPAATPLLRYSATLEDAEDAYQRGLEILLTKARGSSSGMLAWDPGEAPGLMRWAENMTTMRDSCVAD